MQKKLLVLFVAVLALALGACSGPADTADPAVETAAQTEAEPEAEAEAPDAAQEADLPDVEDADLRLFTIVPDQSQVRFVIDEVLRGEPVTVVGVNNGVNGQVAIDVDNPANTQIGPIEVDAAGFVTDADRRNGAIRRFVLQSGQFSLVTFNPTAVNGLPERVAVGDTFDFQVTGDLTILDTTNSVTFAASANVISADELRITGASTINRTDFGITIPSVPFVASVAEEVDLELDLVTMAAE